MQAQVHRQFQEFPRILHDGTEFADFAQSEKFVVSIELVFLKICSVTVNVYRREDSENGAVFLPATYFEISYEYSKERICCLMLSSVCICIFM